MPDYEPTEYLATLYLLRMSHVDKDILSQFVDEEHSRIDFKGLTEARMWSSSEDLIIRAAFSLWNGNRGCGLGEVCTETLNDGLFTIILEAMAMRRGMQIQFIPTAEDVG
jgi:hypothetical protein